MQMHSMQMNNIESWNKMKFSELDLCPELLQAVEAMEYQTPTPIQEQAIPPAMEGRDLLGCAQTGTGKTAAFALPILQKLQSQWDYKHQIKALILTPTRELALQIYENFCAYGKHLPLTSCVVFGGVSQNPQTSQLKAGVDVLIATPGRLLDLMNQGFISLRHVETYVLDEADRMLDMGFLPDVRRITSKLPLERQTLLFSATMPKEIAHLAEKLLRNPVEIHVSPESQPVELITQKVYLVDKPNKPKLLTHLIQSVPIPQVLVFTRTKHGADRVVRQLNRDGISAQAIHGDKSQNNRQRALQSFKEWKIQALVATDIAARGLDIEELPFVVNYDLPDEPETYVHRIGRTGRAGQSGTAISFCDQNEKSGLRDIEMIIDKLLDVEYDNPFPLGSYVPEPGAVQEKMPQREGRNARGQRGGRAGTPSRGNSQGRGGESREKAQAPKQNNSQNEQSSQGAPRRRRRRKSGGGGGSAPQSQG